MVESLIMDSEAVTRTVTRISHEIIGKKGSSDEIVIIEYTIVSASCSSNS